MTIKPVTAPTQKRGNSADTEKKETLGQVVVEQKPHESLGQSPRREVYEDLSRTHRRSPHKSSRSKRRDHIDQHGALQFKRDRNEREPLTNRASTPPAPSNVVPKCSSPHRGNMSPHLATGNNSPAHVSSIPTPSSSAECLSNLACQSSSPQTQSSNTALETIEESFSGYNSGDEHLQPKENSTTAEEWQRRDEQFAKCMNDGGYILRNVEEDGACLFRAISLQIYGDEDMHDVIRQHTMDYIYKNREYFSHFVTEDINSYIKRKRRKDSHGNHIEIQAMSEIYNRPVEVYCYKPTPINIFNSEQLKNGYAPLRLSYQRGSHYNAILDPYNATVGVGLGLSGYKPDLQTKEAVRLSEQLEIEQTMFEDKLKSTDWEATNEAIEEQIARESYLQWCRDNLQRTRGGSSATVTTATVTAATATVTTASATITSSQATKFLAENQASPSKFSMLQSNRKCPSTVTSATATATITSSASTSLNETVTAHNAVNSAKLNITEMKPLDPSLSLTAKTLSSLPCSNKTDAQNELGYASDDTDRSSVSSSGYSGGSSSSSSPSAGHMDSMKKRKKRSKKVKALSATENISCSNRKRRCDSDITSPTLNNSDELLNATPANSNASSTARNSPKSTSPRSRTPESEQQPCTSKQSCSKPVVKPDTKANTSNDDEAASTSTSAKKDNEHPSSFYQELLEASYAADGHGQLSESEMLQRAIQMSTRDYIEDQKRRYLYRP